MKTAVITIAGVSSRFNEGIIESEKKHKCIYYEKDKKDHAMDRIIVVGGYMYEEILEYLGELPDEYKDKIITVYNAHYSDYSSGYSLYVGLKKAFDECADLDEVCFIEGDLDIDEESFQRVLRSDKDVLTYSFSPIVADKSVVLYQNDKENYKYAFNRNHGFLKITDPFSIMLNSGQMWKFRNIDILKKACEGFYTDDKYETNLLIIQKYIDLCDSKVFELIGLKRWTNCNTREDYKKILVHWENES